MDDLAAEERQTYSWIGNTLRSGLYLSMVVMLAGLVAAGVVGHGSRVVLPLDRVPARLALGDPAAIVDLGILLLFAAPLAGVLIALGRFFREHDVPFIAITLALVLLLVAGFAVALR